MLKLNESIFTLALTALGLLASSTGATAFTVTPQPDLTDQGFQNLISTGQFTEVFVAQSRIGNNALNGDQEIDLLNPQNNLLPVAQAQRVWTSGQPVDFSLEYTGSSVNYTVGGQVLSSNAFSTPVNEILLRTRAGSQSEMSLSDLLLNGQPVSSLFSSTLGSAASSDVDYLQIGDIQKPFTLTGKSTMIWTGIIPVGSALAYQIKVGTTPSSTVPEPSTVGALLLTSMAAVGYSKRKKATD
jgi:hypothetical protein